MSHAQKQASKGNTQEKHQVSHARRQDAEERVRTLVSSLDQVEYMKIDSEMVSQMCLFLGLFLGVVCVFMGAEKASLLTLPLLVVYHNYRPLDMPAAFVIVGPLCVILSSLDWSILQG